MNFRKSTCLFLAFLLLVSNIGFAFNVHYCGGKIASVSLDINSPVAEKSCCAKKEKKATCCKDKVVQVENKSDNATIKIFFFQLAIPAIVQQFNVIAFPGKPFLSSNQILGYNADANAPPLFKLYNQYILYA